MKHTKNILYHSIRITQLFWLLPLCYYLCLYPLNPNDIIGWIQMIFYTIIGLNCFIFYEKKVGLITAYVAIVYWLTKIMELFVIVLIQKISNIDGFFNDMIVSYKIVFIFDIIIMFIVPLLLIFHQKKSDTKQNIIISFLLSLFIFLSSIYSNIWHYNMEDKLAYSEYKYCKKTVEYIENYYKINGCYPSQLNDMKAQSIYSLSRDGASYQIVDMFEHRHNRCHKNKEVFFTESISYDSNTRKWEHSVH